jgi:dipeptidyl aminopeptidase/acylaminoacyl peptidase
VVKVKKNTKKPKKEDKDNGYRLFVRNTESGKEDTLTYVVQHTLAKRSKKLLWSTTGKGDTLLYGANPKALQSGVYLLDLEKYALQPLRHAKGKFQQLCLSEDGQNAAFLADLDTTKALIRPWQLIVYTGKDSARMVVQAQSPVLPTYQGKQMMLSEYYRMQFSESGEQLYFGVAPLPILPDTTLLPEEIVQVEVWASSEKHLYTELKNKVEQDKKRAFPAVWDLKEKQIVFLGSLEVPELRFQEQRNASLALGFNEEPYAQYLSWEGTAHKDVYAVYVNAGKNQRIITDLRCEPRLSPEAKYIAFWSARDTAWFAWSARNNQIARLTNNLEVPFYEEETDVPDYPDNHGVAGWLEEDEAMLVYDRFDLWRLDPTGKKVPRRLTNGRASQTTYRYIRLDPEAYNIPAKSKILLHQFNEQTKAEGYCWLNLENGLLENWQNADFAYSRQPIKAKDAEALIFTREQFRTFPDLYYVQNGAQKTPLQISHANPQQSEYQWGSIELIHWTSLSGQTLQGLLIKPEGFDPSKKYPMIVNFYERTSDELHRYRTPDFGRSSINWSYYASRGYLLFIPDIVYRTGYPGESAYDAVVSGITALMNQGFVDPARIGMQGHSWGGYQSAYLVTRTHLFACAEAGAPVANMTSAYGGIRWESGLNRAFQYEHQQSRIGGTLWQYPMRYLENSPLFALDKVETPLLILHNDKDGAVPWQQGIELYAGLRRLGKPSWLLNYNEEPHWPVKLQNRIDFQTRMQQFFDYYLKDAPMPRWMQRGVPPLEKGILQGLETSDH